MKNQGLTPRQREILSLIANGLTSRQIGEKLGLSFKTVETHRSQMMERLGIHNIAGLVRYGLEEGFADTWDKDREKILSPQMGGSTSEADSQEIPNYTDAVFSELTNRERELMRLIATGYSNREAAKVMGIANKTAENHRLRIMRKLKLKNAVHLCRRAIRCGLIAA